MNRDDLNGRLFNFAVLGGGIILRVSTSKCLNTSIKSKWNIGNTISPPKVLKFLPNLPKTPEFNVIRYQLAKSATSSGANYEEAQAGSSKADFNNKVRISLREMRESNYPLTSSPRRVGLEL